MGTPGESDVGPRKYALCVAGGRAPRFFGVRGWQMDSREGRALPLSQGTGRWLFRSFALGQTHRDEGVLQTPADRN